MIPCSEIIVTVDFRAWLHLIYSLLFLLALLLKKLCKLAVLHALNLPAPHVGGCQDLFDDALGQVGIPLLYFVAQRLSWHVIAIIVPFMGLLDNKLSYQLGYLNCLDSSIGSQRGIKSCLACQKFFISHPFVSKYGFIKDLSDFIYVVLRDV